VESEKVTQPTNAEVLTARPTVDNAREGVRSETELLVSVQDSQEAALALESGIAWLDLKAPARGPLGRPDLELVQRTRMQLLQRGQPIRWSIAGGELLDWQPSQDMPFLASLGTSGALKLALANCKNSNDWPQRAEQIFSGLPSREQAILVHYADAEAVQAPGWDEVLRVSIRLGSRYVLIDTAIKNGKSLLQHCPVGILRERIAMARSEGLQVAIAGSLPMHALPTACSVGARWVGLRGALCHETRTSKLSRERLEQALSIVGEAKRSPTDFQLDSPGCHP
jgi:uncharacterized protein (UPF0264 family)